MPTQVHLRAASYLVNGSRHRCRLGHRGREHPVGCCSTAAFDALDDNPGRLPMGTSSGIVSDRVCSLRPTSSASQLSDLIRRVADDNEVGLSDHG